MISMTRELGYLVHLHVMDNVVHKDSPTYVAHLKQKTNYTSKTFHLILFTIFIRAQLRFFRKG